MSVGVAALRVAALPGSGSQAVFELLVNQRFTALDADPLATFTTIAGGERSGLRHADLAAAETDAVDGDGDALAAVRAGQNAPRQRWW